LKPALKRSVPSAKQVLLKPKQLEIKAKIPPTKLKSALKSSESVKVSNPLKSILKSTNKLKIDSEQILKSVGNTVKQDQFGAVKQIAFGTSISLSADFASTPESSSRKLNQFQIDNSPRLQTHFQSPFYPSSTIKRFEDNEKSKRIAFGTSVQSPSVTHTSTPELSIQKKLNHLQILNREKTPFKSQNHPIALVASAIKKIEDRLISLKTPLKYREMDIHSPEYELIAETNGSNLDCLNERSPENTVVGGFDLPIDEFNSLAISENRTDSRPDSSAGCISDSIKDLNTRFDDKSIYIFNLGSPLMKRVPFRLSVKPTHATFSPLNSQSPAGAKSLLLNSPKNFSSPVRRSFRLNPAMMQSPGSITVQSSPRNEIGTLIF
jgi:hypothetical protein